MKLLKAKNSRKARIEDTLSAWRLMCMKTQNPMKSRNIFVYAFKVEEAKACWSLWWALATRMFAEWWTPEIKWTS